MTLRWGVLGLGTISRAVHLPLIARTPGHELVALSDLDPGRTAELARTYGARALEVPELLAAEDVDAVLIATPGRHAALAAAALAAGKHVLAEKPFALSVAEIEEAGSAAATAGRHLQVGYMKAHDRAVEIVRDALPEIGALRLVQISVRHPEDRPQVGHLRLPPPAPPGAAALGRIQADDAAEERALDASLGSDAPAALRRLFRFVLSGSIVHELSLLRSLGLGLPRFDHADLIESGGAAPPSVFATGRFDSGVRFVLDWVWSPDRPDYTERVALVGSAGAVDLDVAPPYRIDAPSAVSITTPQGTRRPPVEADGAFQRQLEAFACAVSGGQPDPHTSAAAAAEDLRALREIADLVR